MDTRQLSQVERLDRGVALIVLSPSNFSNTATFEAAQADTDGGLIQLPPCNRCQTGKMTFPTCSIPKNATALRHFNGACFSCFWHGETVDCSFYSQFVIYSFPKN